MKRFEEEPSNRSGARSGALWTAAAVLVAVAGIVSLAAGRRDAEPLSREAAPATRPLPGANAAGTGFRSAPPAKRVVKEPKTPHAELEAARARLAELARIYLPQAPAYREQFARVEALEAAVGRGDPPALRAARVDLAVALARGLGGAHPKVLELTARIEGLERRAGREE